MPGLHQVAWSDAIQWACSVERSQYQHALSLHTKEAGKPEALLSCCLHVPLERGGIGNVMFFRCGSCWHFCGFRILMYLCEVTVSPEPQAKVLRFSEQLEIWCSISLPVLSRCYLLSLTLWGLHLCVRKYSLKLFVTWFDVFQMRYDILCFYMQLKVKSWSTVFKWQNEF